jgi:hypothetical protein
MPKLPDNRRAGERNDAIIHSHERFIERHRLILLRYLDGTAPQSVHEPDVLGYIESVLTEWQEVFGNSAQKVPSAKERTFWFALYLLEEIVESPGPHIDSYEKRLMGNLVEAREMLRRRQLLPLHRFMATRPDGT